MKDNLLNIGSIVEVENPNNDIEPYMIIGKRVINHETMKAWDYISVPYSYGYKRNIRIKSETVKEENIILKCERVKREENFFYFNHYEIEKVLYKCNYSVKEMEGE